MESTKKIWIASRPLKTVVFILQQSVYWDEQSIDHFLLDLIHDVESGSDLENRQNVGVGTPNGHGPALVNHMCWVLHPVWIPNCIRVLHGWKKHVGPKTSTWWNPQSHARAKPQWRLALVGRERIPICSLASHLVYSSFWFHG